MDITVHYLYAFQVVFSDESSLHILDDRRQHVRRRVGNQLHKDCVVQRVKHPLSVMVWGAISVHGVDRLHIVEGTMRQDQYKKMLKTRLLLQMREWFGAGTRRGHISARQWAVPHRQESERIHQEGGMQLLDWPGNSADMNPIENILEDAKGQNE